MLWQITGIRGQLGQREGRHPVVGEAGGLEVGGTAVMYVDKKHKPVTSLRRDVTPQSSQNARGQDKHSEKEVLTSTDSRPHKITESSVGG